MFTKEESVLLLVDIQPDFMPGGALAISDGDQILSPLYGLMESSYFKDCVATQDWHPTGHISFASSHPGHMPMDEIDLYGHAQTLWPDHCVQNSAGARLHSDLPWEKTCAVIRKGMDPLVDSYSGFRNNWDAGGKRPPTGLSGYLSERGIENIFVAGLARDVCVKFTALDAVAAGFNTFVIWDLTRPVDIESDNIVYNELSKKGITIVESTQIAQYIDKG